MSRDMIRLPHDAYRLLQTLRAAGHSAYVVGGCVRDSLLGRLPGDWDICTSARPDEMKALFHDQRLILTGEKHGTVAVILHGKPYEMTTYRLDGSYRDHRHPDNVQFVDDLAADLARRDFTINAMAYAPGEGVIDLYGGRSDLAARVVRCVGTPADRFAEDALRILRLEVSQPEGMILLNAKLPDNFSPAIGQQVIPETYNSLLAHTESSAESDSNDATPESAQPTVTDIVTQLWQLLQDDGLLDGLTALDISDTSQLSFTYQGRVDVLLGNSSSLDYKLRLAAKILTDPDKGLSGSDRGTLDVSDQLEDGEIRGYFQPYEQPTPTPEPAPEPDPESENAENAEEPPPE